MASNPVNLFMRWQEGFVGPSVSVHRDDVVALSAVHDEASGGSRTKLHLRGGGSLDVSERFDTVRLSSWWNKTAAT